MQSIIRMYKSVADFFVAENAGLFLGRGSYAHPARFIALKKNCFIRLAKSDYKKQAENTLQG